MKQLFILLLSISALSIYVTPTKAQSQSVTRETKESRLLAQSSKEDESSAVPASDIPQTITDIQVRFLDARNQPTTGKTNPDLITREFKLQSGDVYNAKLAQQGLAAVNDLIVVDRASLELEPISPNNRPDKNTPADNGMAAERVNLVVNVVEASSFFFVLGGTLPPPTALKGSIRPQSVVSSDDKGNGIAASFRVGAINLGGENQGLTLGVAGGAQTFGLDLDYRRFIKHDTGYAANIFTRSNVEPEFDEGDIDVDLPDNSDPWVNRVGGGIEYFRPLVDDWVGALGLNYQLVSVRDAAFADRLEPVDELGNSLTISDDGQDQLLSVNFVTSLDKRNDFKTPTKGYRLLFSTDQSIPVGDADILYNRLAANYTQYLPFPLFGFTQGGRTLVLNVQGGTILGDVPPYEAFTLGGSSSVRGYGGGELATGRSFVQATAEYRFPILGFAAYNEQFDVGGSFFFDYGSVFNTQDNVTGQPGAVRDKPGDGFGYGVGLRTLTPVGLAKVEFALNDEGDSEIIFKLGDRF